MSESHNRIPRLGVKANVTGTRLNTEGDGERSAEGGQREEEPGPSSAGPQRLKVVTVAPRGTTDSQPVPSPSRAGKVDPYVGAKVDNRYQVESVLGEGGMGVVYRCTHTIIGKTVAMKVLRSDLASDSEVTERFLNEAKSASAIGNPHIIDISDFGQFPDGSTYFIMEYLAGKPLARALADQGPLPLRQILDIARQLAEGLAAAHDAGIVHRDLKPDNIFLISRGGSTDFVKILDFGIAKVSKSGGGRLTRAGAVFGTPHYMSPEQAAGTAVDHRGDIYSLGVILYEMASGRVPFDADNLMGILTQHLYKAPASVRSVAPAGQNVPPGLEAVILKCLSKRPEDRYATMQDFARDLERLQAGQLPAAVEELASRSDDLDLPAEYFRDALASASGTRSTEPAIEPLPTRRRWPLVLGLLLAGGAVAAYFVSSRPTVEREAPRPPPVAATTPPPAPPPAPETDPVVSPANRQVVLAVDPLDAQVFQGDKDLGPSPVMLEVPPGQALELTIRRAGYREIQLSIDGSEPRKSVALEAIARPSGGSPRKRTPPAKPSAQRPAKPTPRLGGGEIVNPWD